MDRIKSMFRRSISGTSEPPPSKLNTDVAEAEDAGHAKVTSKEEGDARSNDDNEAGADTRDHLGYDGWVSIPQRGFLNKDEYIDLPVYAGRDAPCSPQRHLSDYPSVIDMAAVVHILETGCHICRCLICEIARLKQSPFAMIHRGRLKLVGPAMELDMELDTATAKRLVDLDKLKVAIHQTRNSKDSKKAMAKATKSLRRMEKKLRDDIISELKSGLVYKTDVNYEKLRQKFRKVHDEIKAICMTALHTIQREVETPSLQ